MNRRFLPFILAVSALGTGHSLAADKNWDNGSGNYVWNTTSVNWSGTTWSASGDAAIFNGFGNDTISVPAILNVGSINVASGNFTFNGGGSITFTSAGTGTLAPGTVSVTTGSTAAINVPFTTPIGLVKSGGGTLQLGAPAIFSGTVPNFGGSANLQIGSAGLSAIGSGGTVELTAANVLPGKTTVAIGAGWLNIGAFNTTIESLTYMNSVASGTYQSPNGNNGVYGTGSLKVTGAITAQYNLGTNGSSNTLAANLDIGGGTQQFLLNTVPTALGYTALHVTGSIGNGSVLKSYSSSQAGGIALYGNNTYTGPTTINGGLGGAFTAGAFGNVVAGTNASASLNVVNGFVTLFGANGSYGAAAAVSVSAGGTLSLDNNSTTNGTNGPAVLAGNNSNRLADAAAVTLAHGTLQILGATGLPSAETVGSLNTFLGLNTLTATANGGGTAALTVSGDWTQGSRAVTQFRGTTLGSPASSTIKVNGAVPTAVGGLIPRAYGVNTAPAETGFVKYDAANGITLLAAGDYQSAFGSGGNVSIAASAGPVGTQAINSLRATATSTVSFNTGSVLTVTSGQILATTGTLTLDATGPAGVIAFDSAPATMLALGTITSNAPLTGTGGIIKSGTGTLNVNGSLAGMSGMFAHHAGTTTLNTPYAGDFEVVSGTFNLRTNLTTPGRTFALGNPATPANTVGLSAGLNIANIAVTAIAADLVVSNGSPSPTVTTVTISQQGGNNGIVQHFSGSVTLNSTLNISGGGNTTNTILFSGPLVGNAPLRVQNGTVRFTGNSTAYDGSFVIGNGGNTSLVTFDGTNASATGSVSIGPGTGLATSTTVRVSSGNAVPGGPINLLGGILQPTANLTLANAIVVTGNSNLDVPNPAVSATFSGPISGTANLTKTGAGRLTLTDSSSVVGGTLTVGGGILAVSGSITPAAATVASGGTLQGGGKVLSPVSVAVGGTLRGGDTYGTLRVGGPVTLASDATAGATLRVDGDDTANGLVLVTGATNTFDLASLTGSNKFTVRVDGASLSQFTTYTWELVRTQDNASGLLVNGTVGTGGVIPASNYILTSSQIGQFADVTLVANANSLVLTFTPVPEPGSLLAAAAGAAGLWRVVRRIRRGDTAPV